jgi:hypothetical protein
MSVADWVALDDRMDHTPTMEIWPKDGSRGGVRFARLLDGLV